LDAEVILAGSSQSLYVSDDPAKGCDAARAEVGEGCQGRRSKRLHLGAIARLS